MLFKCLPTTVLWSSSDQMMDILLACLGCMLCGMA